MVLKLPSAFTGSFHYVDCGVRGDLSKPLLSIFKDSRYIGFDPQLSLPSEEGDASIYFPVALGKEAGFVEFNTTQNPNCSSVFIPNQEFLGRFKTVSDFFNVTESKPMKIVALDDYLPKNSINQVDFLELDTQGSELDILLGAEKFLRSSVLGVRVEVEFSAMYNNQPLFADVDSLLRQMGFMLFDLERYHLRRKTGQAQILCKEQIVWGQALYFKDWGYAPDAFTKQQLSRLAMMASFHGFHSYAFEILEYLQNGNVNMLSLEERDQLARILNDPTPFWELSLRESMAQFLKKIPRRIGAFSGRIKSKVTSPEAGNYFWKD